MKARLTLAQFFELSQSKYEASMVKYVPRTCLKFTCVFDMLPWSNEVWARSFFANAWNMRSSNIGSVFLKVSMLIPASPKKSQPFYRFWAMQSKSPCNQGPKEFSSCKSWPLKLPCKSWRFEVHVIFEVAYKSDLLETCAQWNWNRAALKRLGFDQEKAWQNIWSWSQTVFKKVEVEFSSN